MAGFLRPSMEIPRVLPAEGNVAVSVSRPRCGMPANQVVMRNEGEQQNKKIQKSKPSGLKKAEVAIEEKIEASRARRAAQLEEKKQRVRALRKNRVQEQKEAPKIVKNKKVVQERKEAPRTENNKEIEGQKEEPKVEKWTGSIKLGFQDGFFEKFGQFELIGKGGFGTVYKVRTKTAQAQPVAVKVMRKSKISEGLSACIRKEVQIMVALNGQPNTVRFYGAFEDDKLVFIVMELLEGRDMYHTVKSRGCDEVTAKSWMQQILAALEALHGKCIAHRDLKFDNLMFDTSGNVRLIDYGLSDYVIPGERLRRMAGTPGYIAPEVFDKAGGLESDMWSLGVIAHQLLTGEFPFPDPKDESDINAWRPDMRYGPDYSDDAKWGNVSLEARHFVKCLLNPDPCVRMNVTDAKDHKWLMPDQGGSLSMVASSSASVLGHSSSCFY